MLILQLLTYNKKQKIFSEKQKEFRDGLSYSTPQKSEETRVNAIRDGMGPRLGNGISPLFLTF